MDKIKRILIITTDATLSEVLRFCFDGWGYEVFIRNSYEEDITSIKKISPHVIIIDVQAARHVDLRICQLLKDDFVTSLIPVITLINKRHLRSHLLYLKHGVDDYLIKPPDPLDLRIRIEMAIRRSQYSYYASPLTGLPGGRILEETLGDKIHRAKSFSFGYIDIDHFKYFNDVYGYLKGDRVIMHTAYLLYDTIKKCGKEGDFIGHIGGDDFVFITTPDNHERICHHFISSFNRTIPFHYTSEDRRNGYINAPDRTRKIRKVPLMGVSIAVVNKIPGAHFKSIIDINERVAEIKKYLKNISGSKFMVDRRDAKTDTSAGPHIYNHKKREKEHKPLGQILVEKKLISPDQLDEALRIHWRRGVVFGEILKEIGLLKKETLDEALTMQENT